MDEVLVNGLRGMILLNLFVVPLFFVVLRKQSSRIYVYSMAFALASNGLVLVYLCYRLAETLGGVWFVAGLFVASLLLVTVVKAVVGGVWRASKSESP